MSRFCVGKQNPKWGLPKDGVTSAAAACKHGISVRDAYEAPKLKTRSKRVCSDFRSMESSPADTIEDLTSPSLATDGDRKQREHRRLKTIIDQLTNSRARGHGQPQLGKSVYCLLEAKIELVRKCQRKVPNCQNVKPVSFKILLLCCIGCSR